MKAKIDYTILQTVRRRHNELRRQASKQWLMIRQPNGTYDILKTY